ncbi:MAG: hypothetical protein [Microviridae sp.]|nr:MAG: hypothetical protein [Microviridae sp.]
MSDIVSQAATGAAGGSFFGPPGALIGAGVGAASALIGGQNSARASMEMQREAQNHQIRMRRTQYQATVKDMRAAGLNPMMLAMGSSLSQGMGAGMAPSGQFGEGITKAGGKMADAVMMGAQLKQMNSATDLNRELANKAIQDAALIHTQIGTEGAKAWSAQMANEVERARLQVLVENMAKQGVLTEAETARIYADMGLNDARRRNLEASSAASNAAAALDRAGLPSMRYKNSAVGIFMDEANRTAGTVQSFLPWKKGGFADVEARKYRRSGRVYQNPE